MGLSEKFNFVQRLKRSQAVTQVDILGERVLSQGDSQWKGSETEECFEYKEQQGGQCNWRGGNEIKSSRRHRENPYHGISLAGSTNLFPT